MKLKNYGLVIVLVLISSFTGAFAQERNITGTVTSATDNLPIPGVNVIVKGTTRGVQTDFDGNFTIKASAGETLEFSFVGMKTVDVKLGSNTSVNISMQEDIGMLEEVVVQAYRTATKETSNIA